MLAGAQAAHAINTIMLQPGSGALVRSGEDTMVSCMGSSFGQTFRFCRCVPHVFPDGSGFGMFSDVKLYAVLPDGTEKLLTTVKETINSAECNRVISEELACRL